MLSGGPAPSIALPLSTPAPQSMPECMQCGKVSDKMRSDWQCCCDSGNDSLRQVLEMLAKVLSYIDSHLGSIMSPVVSTLSDCCGIVQGRVNNACDRINAVSAKCEDRIRSHCQAIISECYRYAYQVPEFAQAMQRAAIEGAVASAVQSTPELLAQTAPATAIAGVAMPAGGAASGQLLPAAATTGGQQIPGAIGFGGGGGGGSGGGGVGGAGAFAGAGALAAAAAAGIGVGQGLGIGIGQGLGIGGAGGIGIAGAAAAAGAAAGAASYSANAGNTLIVDINMAQLVQLLTQSLVQAALTVAAQLGIAQLYQSADPSTGLPRQTVGPACKKKDTAKAPFGFVDAPANRMDIPAVAPPQCATAPEEGAGLMGQLTGGL